VRLVAEADQPVIVRELDVTVERDRPQVREVIEAVALKARPQVDLRRHAQREQRGEQHRDAHAREAPRRDQADDPGGECHERQGGKAGVEPSAVHIERPASHRARTQLERYETEHDER
jgi:hypothetical protein